ncbi:hypothetical protein EBR56_06585, partial [bacterium]|nr:hypothetical protein [bacterium]
MHSTPTFTGRARRRSTRPWARAGDGIARLLITLGGIGTIIAVLLVAVFLLAVALPLFQRARIAFDGETPLLRGPGAPSAMGTDEDGGVAWMLDGAEARLRVFDPRDGAALLERTLADAGFAGATTIRIRPGTLQGVAGYADGSFRTCRLGLESAFLA